MRVKKTLKNKNNCGLEIPIIIIVVRAVFHENNKYYRKVFLDKCLFKLWTRTHNLSRRTKKQKYNL